MVGGTAVLCIVASILPLWDTDLWLVRLWDFPRLQLMVIMLVLLPLWLWLARRSRVYWPIAGGLAASTAWQATHAAPYLPTGIHRVESTASCAPGRSIALLNINVFQDNRDFASTLDVVRRSDADVVLFLETDPGWARALSVLRDRYPNVAAAPIPNTYGIIMMSRLPMRAAVKYRMQPAIPSIDATVTLPSGDEVELYALHPEPPLPGDDAGERDAELVMAGRDVRRSGGAAIVLGDLNDVAWSKTSRLFRDVSGTADPRVGRGLYPTFHAKYPLFQWPLDHSFVTPHWRVQKLDRLPHVGSDHYPIYYRFCLDRPAEKRLTARVPDAEVRAEAREQAAEGRAEKREEGDVGGE